MECSLKSFVLAVAVIVCLGLSSTPASAKKTIRITNVPMQVTSAELQRRIQYLEAQVNTLNSRTTALVSNKTQTQVQVISGSPASSVQSGTGSGRTDFSDLTGATKPQDNADVTSENISAGIIGQGALAVQSTQGLGFSNLRIQTPIDNTSPTTVSISFGAGMVLMNSAGATITLPTAVSGQALNSAASGAGGLDTGSPATGYIYYIFEIYNPTTQTAAALMSLSPTTPTLPSGYTYYRWIGAVPWLNTYIVAFIQNNYDLWFTETFSHWGALTQTSYTAIDFTGLVPPLPYISLVTLSFDPISTGNSGLIGLSISTTDNGNGQCGAIIYTANASWLEVSNIGQFSTPFQTSLTLYCEKLGSGTGTLGLNIQGYRLNL